MEAKLWHRDHLIEGEADAVHLDVVGEAVHSDLGQVAIVLAETIPFFVMGRISEQAAHPLVVGTCDFAGNTQILVYLLSQPPQGIGVDKPMRAPSLRFAPPPCQVEPK